MKISDLISNNYSWKNKSDNVKTTINYMLNRTLRMFKYDGLPDTIPPDELEKVLQINGTGVITKYNEKLYVFIGTPTGELNPYGEYDKYNINNPYVNFSKEIMLGVEGVKIKNDSMGMGLKYIFDKYSTLLSEAEISMMLGTINKRIQTLLSASDNQTLESAKLFLKDIEAGKLGIIAESQLLESLKVNNSNNQINLKELFELHQYIKSCFFNEIGLGCQSNFKKERLVSQEITYQSDNIYPLIDDMLETRKEFINKINELYGTTITVEFGGTWTVRPEDEPNPEPANEPINEPINDTFKDKIKKLIS